MQKIEGAFLMRVLFYLAFIYRKYLAKYFIFRVFKASALIVGRFVYRWYSIVKKSPFSGRYQLLAVSAASAQLISRVIPVSSRAGVTIPAPNFTGYCAESAARKSKLVRVEAPLLKIVVFSEVTVVGGMDFVFKQGTAIHHDLFDPVTHQCPAENFGVICIDRKKAELDLYLTCQLIDVDSGVSLIGQSSRNYAHWLTETLPKLAIIDSSGDYSQLPLLVDDGLHENIYASLDLINKNCREIIKVKRWEAVSVKNLVTIPSPGYERYAPHDLHSKEAEPYINSFSPMALQMLRDAVKNALGVVVASSKKVVYLTRSPNSLNIRQISNLLEVESVLEEYGAHVVSLDSMGFIEQVKACIDARIVIAPIGASLANMIFCPPGCKIVVLSPYYDEANYYYYSNLGGALGYELHYVLGPQENKKQHPFHRNYSIETGGLVLF